MLRKFVASRLVLQEIFKILEREGVRYRPQTQIYVKKGRSSEKE